MWKPAGGLSEPRSPTQRYDTARGEFRGFACTCPRPLALRLKYGDGETLYTARGREAGTAAGEGAAGEGRVGRSGRSGDWGEGGA